MSSTIDGAPDADISEPAFVAVGVPVGIAARSDAEADEDKFFLSIRLGNRFIALDRFSAAAWSGAATPAPFSVLVNIAGNPQDVHELIATGLLVPIPRPRTEGDTDLHEPFFELIPIPLSRILDWDLSGDGSWIIGDWLGNPRAELSQFEYLVWSNLNGRISLSGALSLTATAVGQEIGSMQDRVTELVFALLESRSIVLDSM